jgi:hypothetical protein
MISTIVRSKHLDLPDEIAKRLEGKRVTFIETEAGVLIKPMENVVRAVRGMLKGSGFSTQQFMAQKRKEKDLE